MNLSSTFLTHFETLEDPRLNNHNRRHELLDILVITILGTICGADNWTEIYEFGVSKYDWLQTFLRLPHGIPSHDTFERVFSLINPTLFESYFARWIDSLEIDLDQEIIAIDSKTLRGSDFLLAPLIITEGEGPLNIKDGCLVHKSNSAKGSSGGAIIEIESKNEFVTTTVDDATNNNLITIRTRLTRTSVIKYKGCISSVNDDNEETCCYYRF